MLRPRRRIDHRTGGGDRRQSLREQLWIRLMLALNRAGRRTDALSAHRRLVDLLDDELGIRPDPRWSSSRPISVAEHHRDHRRYRRHRARGRRALQADLRTAPPARRAHRNVGGRGRLVLTGKRRRYQRPFSCGRAFAQTADELGVVHVGRAPRGSAHPPSGVDSGGARTGRTDQDFAGTSSTAVDTKSGRASACLEMLASSLAEKAGQRPTLIVIDDLHRADRTAYDVLKLLLGRLSRLPVLIVGTLAGRRAGRPRRASTSSTG